MWSRPSPAPYGYGRRPHGLARWAVLTVLTLSGCGYEPLYRQSPINGTTVAAGLSSVDVDWVADRSGQQLRNALEQRLAPNAGNPGPRYHLKIVFNNTSADVAVRRLDATVSRADLHVVANWALLDSNDQMVWQGVSEVVLNYAVQSNQYPTIVAINNARAQGAELVADDITRQLQAFFSRLPSVQPASPIPSSSPSSSSLSPSLSP